MGWETLCEGIWVCPNCGKKVSIRFRMDDWNRSEYIYSEEGGLSYDSNTDPSPARCRECGIEMIKKEIR